VLVKSGSCYGSLLGLAVVVLGSGLLPFKLWSRNW
jgi:hypothetical protein